jgi:HlyD family secretion protein
MTDNAEGGRAREILNVIGAATGSGRGRILIISAGGLLLLLFVVLTFTLLIDESEFQYTTAPVTRGDLTVTVTATGALEPVNQVEVGTEVSGTVRRVYVDYNDRVRAGQILATLDTERFSAQAAQSSSSLKSAEAKLTESRATALQTEQELKKLDHLRELSGGKLPSQQELQAAHAAYDRAAAGESTARAQIEEARARLRADRINLSKAVIRSPINGIVLKRQIEPGQTVAASLQTPVLFLLAESLKELRLIVAVDEADIGRVKEGQGAAFTVDAYPEKSFSAKIVQVRFSPQSIEGVVTYETVLYLKNEDLLLRPGMTATAEITVEKIRDAILVPNGALRFEPLAELEVRGTGLIGALMPRFPRSLKRTPEQAGEGANRNMRTVWTLSEGKPVSIPIRIGPTDGANSVLVAGELQPGQELLTDMVRTSK